MFKRIARWSGTALAFAIASVVNPAYVAGCVSSGDEGTGYNKAEADKEAEHDLTDMLAEMNTKHTWSFFKDAQGYEFDLELERATRAEFKAGASREAPFTSVAHACGTVTLYQTASACITIHEMPVKGKLTLRRLTSARTIIVSDVPVVGTLDDLDYARFEFGDSTISFESQELQIFNGQNLGADKLDVLFDTDAQ